MVELNEKFWSDRYNEGNTGWDIGYVSTPIKEYIDQLEDKEIKILIPGAGNAYEAEYLWQNGFKHVDVLDLSRIPLESLGNRVSDWPANQLIEGDFFKHTGSYDLIFEQTFFCALDPKLRGNYVAKMKELLKGGGKLVGLMFKIPLFDDRPPFGGSEKDYLPLFENDFHIMKMEEAYNSIEPRAGSELWVSMTPI